MKSLTKQSIKLLIFPQHGNGHKLSDYTKVQNTAFIVKRFDERGWKGLEKNKYYFGKSRKNSRNELLGLLLNR
jgi:hypothetical protein